MSGLRAPGLLAAAVLLCALPAAGALPDLPTEVADALTQIDSAPSRDTLNAMFPTPQAALDKLRQVALDPTDTGVQLRAIRALPAYCPSPCANNPVRDTLLSLIDNYSRTMHGPQDIMRLRAAVEALGAMRSGLASDVTLLKPLLDDMSRDVRATAVRALRNICNQDAITPLSMHYQSETTEQVKHEIYDALRDLLQCT
ncbi:MAG TPA: HEAT repeat domain-containing protein [Kofleriaceae bacterium]|nr:HEAT repeat domain-containing protein [Kofleriaceae bacterium]